MVEWTLYDMMTFEKTAATENWLGEFDCIEVFDTLVLQPRSTLLGRPKCLSLVRNLEMQSWNTVGVKGTIPTWKRQKIPPKNPKKVSSTLSYT